MSDNNFNKLQHAESVITAQLAQLGAKPVLDESVKGWLKESQDVLTGLIEAAQTEPSEDNLDNLVAVAEELQDDIKECVTQLQLAVKAKAENTFVETVQTLFPSIILSTDDTVESSVERIMQRISTALEGTNVSPQDTERVAEVLESKGLGLDRLGLLFATATDIAQHQLALVKATQLQETFIERVGNLVENLQREAEQLKEQRKQLTRKRTLPSTLKQQTGYEIKHLAFAVSDAPSLRRWNEARGEVAMVHKVEGSSVQIKFVASPDLDLWGANSPTYQHLRDALQTLEARGVLLLYVVMAWAIEDNFVTVPLDKLIEMVGWNPRSTAERVELRRKVWHWLKMFAAMPVIGARPGTYKDKLTKKEIELESRDPFIVFTGRRDEKDQQRRFDGNEPPVEVTWTAGAWFKTVRENPQVLPYFGDVMKLTGLPTGKAGGAWALSIGMALNQLWRQDAKNVKVCRDEANKPSLKFRHFTRLELLDLFASPDFPVESILNGNNPKRAQKYWDDAIKLLKKAGVIGSYKELDPLPDARKDWTDFWLRKQRLDIRPCAEGLTDAKEIAQAAQTFNKRANRRGAKKPKKT